MPWLAIRDRRKASYNSMAADDFKELFATSLPGLFRVALLITGSYVLAEASLMAALDECMMTGSVSRQWAQSLARRVVIRNAIRTRKDAVREILSVGEKSLTQNVDSRSLNDIPVEFSSLTRIIALGDLERAAFVLRMLERLPLRDCALLLGRSDWEVREAAIRAMRQLADLSNQSRQLYMCDPAPIAMPSWTTKGDPSDLRGLPVH